MIFLSFTVTYYSCSLGSVCLGTNHTESLSQATIFEYGSWAKFTWSSQFVQSSISKIGTNRKKQPRGIFNLEDSYWRTIWVLHIHGLLLNLLPPVLVAQWTHGHLMLKEIYISTGTADHFWMICILLVRFLLVWSRVRPHIPRRRHVHCTREYIQRHQSCQHNSWYRHREPNTRYVLTSHAWHDGIRLLPISLLLLEAVKITKLICQNSSGLTGKNFSIPNIVHVC